MIPTPQIDGQTKTAPPPTSSPTGYWLLPVLSSLGVLAPASKLARPGRPSPQMRKNKKAAALLVQSGPNSFIINQISQKSCRKNEQKQLKIDLFRPFYSQIEDVFHSSRAQFPACLFPRPCSVSRPCSAGVPPAVVRAPSPALPFFPRSLVPCRGPQRQAHVAGVAWFPRSPFSNACVPSPLAPAFTVPAARYERYGRYAYGMDEVWKRYEAPSQLLRNQIWRYAIPGGRGGSEFLRAKQAKSCSRIQFRVTVVAGSLTRRPAS